jgi:hypothetical protein
LKYPLSRSLWQEREGEKEKDMNLNMVAHLSRRGHRDGGETAPASPAGGIACPAKELMRRDGQFAGRLLCVRESFEERNTSASSLCHGRGLSCRFRRGRELAGDLTAASARLLLQLLPGLFWPYQPPRLLPRLTDP